MAERDRRKDPSRFVIVRWSIEETPVTITAGNLETFIEQTSEEKPKKITISASKDTALIEFNKEKKQDFLAASCKDADFWTIKELYGVKMTNDAKVTNLPSNASYNDIYRFFTNTTNTKKTKLDVDIEESDCYPDEGDGPWCVIRFKDEKALTWTLTNQGKFKECRGKKLVLAPYYHEVDYFRGEGVEEPVPDPITIDNIDPVKLRFLKQTSKEDVENQLLSEYFAKISWPRENIHRVQIEYCTTYDDTTAKRRNWSRDVRKCFSDILGQIKIKKREYSQSVWDDAVIKVNELDNDDIMIEISYDDHSICIAGMQGDNTPEPPIIDAREPCITKELPVKDSAKLMAFSALELDTKISEENNVEIDIDKGKIKITGTAKNVDKANTNALYRLNELSIRRYHYTFPEMGVILNTPVMKTLAATTLQNQCDSGAFGWNIETDELVVFYINQNPEKVKQHIFGLVTKEVVSLKGKVTKSNAVKKAIQSVEEKYHPYVILSFIENKDKGGIEVMVICGKDYTECVEEELHTTVTAVLNVKEVLPISREVVQYIQEKMMESLEKDIKKEKLDTKCLDSDKEHFTISIEGDENVRVKLKALVEKRAKTIHASWQPVEEEGITDYFLDEEGLKFIRSQQRSCAIKIATKNEMKESDVHCIVTLETGQAIFAIAGDLTEPKRPVDVVVNAANEELKHGSGLAQAISRKGGRRIQADCDRYIRNNCPLKPGQIYMGRAGRLPCQRVVHAVGPRWSGGQCGEKGIMKEAIVNVLDAVNKDSAVILRAVALPLLSTGVFGFPISTAAEVVLQTLRDKLKSYPNVREVFLYDPNPRTVRAIQDQMDDTFGDRCFHLPVENVAFSKTTMSTFGQRVERSGTRTLPIPGGKKLVFEWGDIACNKADVVISFTPSAPKPSGTIYKALEKAAGVSFTMESTVTQEFTKVYGANIPYGARVQTGTGRLPCTKIYHVYTQQAQDSTTICKNLAEYIKVCLKEAVRTKMKSIAFPAIGMQEWERHAADVALTFIRTVGDFMKLNATSELKDIVVVVYKQSSMAVTSGFDGAMEMICCQRPHRLKAVIEETILPGQVPGGGSVRHASVRPKSPPPPAAQAPPPQPSAPPPVQQGKYNVNANVNLLLVNGHVEKSQTDVIVCTTSSFPKLNGAIANAVKAAGGTTIKNGCDNYKGYPKAGVAITDGGNLSCKKVYYLLLTNYKKPADAKMISDNVTKCLEQAEKDQMASIALPTVGTGGFQYPDVTSAKEMFGAIKTFFQTQRKHLQEVSVIVYPQAHSAVKAFQAEVGNFFKHIGGKPLPQVVPVPAGPAPSTSQHSYTVPGTKTTININFGSLEHAKADVIVDTTTSFPNLNGVIPNQLKKVAGASLLAECKDTTRSVMEGDVVETGGYNLQCKQVYHYVLPTWDVMKKRGARQTIEDFVEKCLTWMERDGHASIAFPSIGTGGYQYDAKTVADGLYSAVQNFGQQHAAYTLHVQLVLFDGASAAAANKIFTDNFPAAGTVPAAASKPQKKVGFKDGGSPPGTPVSPKKQAADGKPTLRKKRNFVLLKITSDDQKNVDATLKAVQKKIAEDTRPIAHELKKEKDFDDLNLVKDAKIKKKIEKFGDYYGVKVEVNEAQRKILIRGLGERTNTCYTKILNLLQELRREQTAGVFGHVVLQYLEWCYTEDDGNIWVPYPKKTAFLLEEAHSKGSKDLTFKDSDDMDYLVDFNKMEEYVKDDKRDATTVNITRKDLATGGLAQFPPNWEPMGDIQNLKEVVLDKAGQEYQQVEAEFKKTSGAFNISNIKEIKRIQNQTLYHQYQTKKKQLQGGDQNKAVEHELWHGIKADTERLISSNGFNRGYSGNTFGGNVWYGFGVYFAVDSEYSCGPNYSPLDNNGWKRVYQVRVLTGNYQQVPRGYQGRYPELVPGSQTERYNAVCDDINNPKEFVIFSDTQAYPDYMIVFK